MMNSSSNNVDNIAGLDDLDMDGEPEGASQEDNGSPNLDIPPSFIEHDVGTTICCLGAGRVGTLSMMVLAHRWPDLQFTVLDTNQNLINSINNPPNTGAGQRIMPFSEPGMDQILNQCPNLDFSTDIHQVLTNCNMIFISVDINLLERPKEVKGNFDLYRWESAIRDIMSIIDDHGQDKYVAIKSTFPIDHKHEIRDRLAGFPNSHLLHVIAIPEFFSEGTAIQDLTDPDRNIVMGRFFNVNDDTRTLFHDLYIRLVNQNHDRIDFLNSTCSVEIGKLLSNASIAAQLSIINIGSSICDEVLGANISDVKRTIQAHPRLSHSFLDSRLSYGGMGLIKDVSYLEYVSAYLGLNRERKFFKLINEMRIGKMKGMVQKIIHYIGVGKTIAIYGFSNKVGTDDVRESPSLYLCRELLQIAHNRLIIHDPVVLGVNILSYFAQRIRNRVQVVANAEGAWGVNAMVFMVRWPEYETMLQQQSNQMINEIRKPSYVFDCCEIIDDLLVQTIQGVQHEIGVYRLGKP